MLIIPSFYIIIVKYSCYISPLNYIIMLKNYIKTHFILNVSYKSLKLKFRDLIFRSDYVIIFYEKVNS